MEGLSLPVKVEPGQFITGRYAFHKIMYPKVSRKNPNPKTVERWLKTLESVGNLTIKTSNKFSLITIVNWYKYQVNDSEDVQQNVPNMSSRCPADVQQMSTNKKDKKDKKDKNIYGEFHNVLLSDEEYQKLTSRLGESITSDYIEQLSEGIASKKYKYSSHYATILSWKRKHDKEQPVQPTKPQMKELVR